MKITVCEVEQRDGLCLVRFSAPCGDASGCWCGEPPEAGDTYDVELDLPPVKRSEVTELSVAEGGEVSSLRDENGVVVLVGRYIASPGVGSGALQLGDSMALLAGELSGLKDGSIIRIEAASVRLYPFTL